MAGESKSRGGSRPAAFTLEDGIADLIGLVVDDCLYNIIHDMVSSIHTSEKKLRMQSAAIQAEAVAASATSGTSVAAPTANAASSAKPLVSASLPPGTHSTNAANYDNGKVTITGNIFKTQKENFCPNCKLPRLSFPLAGTGARVPEDLNRTYCTLHPFIQKPGHDIYGNPFPVDPGKTKKEREALRKLERQEKDSTPGSVDTGTADAESASGDPSVKKLMAGGKGATYVPWQTCPNCKRSLLITKFAQHLEKCMGIGGRPARNTAAARLCGINGSTADSTHGSRVGTPVPSQSLSGKRDPDADSEHEDAPPKKKLKKEKKEKVPRGEKRAAAAAAAALPSSTDKKDSPSLKLKLKMAGRMEANRRSPKTDNTSSTVSRKNKDYKSRTDRGDGPKRDRNRDRDRNKDAATADEEGPNRKKMRLKESSTLPEPTALAQ